VPSSSNESGFTKLQGHHGIARPGAENGRGGLTANTSSQSWTVDGLGPPARKWKTTSLIVKIVIFNELAIKRRVRV